MGKRWRIMNMKMNCAYGNGQAGRRIKRRKDGETRGEENE